MCIGIQTSFKFNSQSIDKLLPRTCFAQFFYCGAYRHALILLHKPRIENSRSRDSAVSALSLLSDYIKQMSTKSVLNCFVSISFHENLRVKYLHRGFAHQSWTSTEPKIDSLYQMAASGGTVSVEERTQLQRVFRLLSLELPLSAITRKLEVKQNCFVFVNLSVSSLAPFFRNKTVSDT